MADIWWPVDNPRITGEFGNSPDFYEQFGQKGHNGIDIGVWTGTPVYACDAGTVVAEGWGKYNSWMGEIAGIYVLLKHWWGFSAYAHLSNTIVSAGQSIAKGQRIATSGATGVGTGPHLHFETFPVNPHWGNGYAGRVNPRIHNIQARGNTGGGGSKPKPNPTKEDTVSKFYHREDKTARSGGRTLKPGDGFYLHTTKNAPAHNATNCVAEVGAYTFVAHVYADGTPGDVLEVKYIWQNKGVNRPHYVETIVIPPSGKARVNFPARRDVGAGDSVFLRADAVKGNKGNIKLTCLDSDATSWKRS